MHGFDDLAVRVGQDPLGAAAFAAHAPLEVGEVADVLADEGAEADDAVLGTRAVVRRREFPLATCRLVAEGEGVGVLGHALLTGDLPVLVDPALLLVGEGPDVLGICGVIGVHAAHDTEKMAGTGRSDVPSSISMTGTAYTHSMIISTLSEDRIPEVVALWEATGLTRPWNDPAADARKALTNDGSTVLIGTDGDTIVASAMVGFDGHRGWVYYVAVDPGWQGTGLGGVMMRAAEEWLRGRGVGKLQLMIREENHAVRSFYRRLGYQTEQVTVMSIRL